jgi:hypothetical protein
MSNKTESVLAVVAAIFVLFSAMVDAKISVVGSIVLMVAFAAYRWSAHGAAQ